jgi:hypothetical protein
MPHAMGSTARRAISQSALKAICVNFQPPALRADNNQQQAPANPMRPIHVPVAALPLKKRSRRRLVCALNIPASFVYRMPFRASATARAWDA